MSNNFKSASAILMERVRSFEQDGYVKRKSHMNKTCCNCLNAYNSPYYPQPQCWNKEWLYEGRYDIDCSVRPDETCGTWQRRADNQNSLVFAKAVQLSLFDLNNFY